MKIKNLFLSVIAYMLFSGIFFNTAFSQTDTSYTIEVKINVDEQIPVKVTIDGKTEQLTGRFIKKNKPFTATLEPGMLEFFQPMGAGLVFSHWEIDYTPQQKGNTKLVVEAKEAGSTVNVQAAYVYATQNKESAGAAKQSNVAGNQPVELKKIKIWSEKEAYKLNDLVLFDGAVYLSQKENNTTRPKLGLCNICGWTALGNPAPAARFYWSPLVPKSGQEITLDAAKSIPSQVTNTKIKSYKWDLGNGKIVEGKTAKITFKENKDYIVTLWVTDENGKTSRKTQIITVSPTDKLVITPPMGWNSYNFFGNIVERPFDEKTFEDEMIEVVDAMVKNDMLQKGYKYINIDYAWASDYRNKDGNLEPNPSYFPKGIDFIVDYIHSKGFKAGIYLTCGIDNVTYDHKPGSIGYESKDAQSIADWGFDYVKYDYRSESYQKRDTKAEMITMSQALRSTGRPIVYSMCEHGRSQPWKWAAPYAELWRIGTDIRDGMISHPKKWSFIFNDLLDDSCFIKSAPYQKPGAINDPDFLVVGLDGKGSAGLTKNSCTPVEYRSQFSLWSLIAAPLIMGNDIRNITPENLETLLNSEIIAIDQDPLVKCAVKIKDENGLQVWAKELTDGKWAVGLYNRSSQTANIKIDWQNLKLPAGVSCNVRDLWAHKDLGSMKDGYSASVAPRACDVIKVSVSK